MKIYEIGTGYTPIPARMGAATEIVVEELTKAFLKQNIPVQILDIKSENRSPNNLPIEEVWVPGCFCGTDVKLGIMHKLKRVAYSVCLAGKIRNILKNTEEKVVLHFHNQYNLFFTLKLIPEKLRKKSLIAYTNHSGIWRLPWEQIERTIHSRYFQEAECMKRADLVFALNRETIDNAVKHAGAVEDRCVLIGNGVNTQVYHPLSAEEKTRAKVALDLEGKKIILQVGSVYENKGQCRSVKLLAPLLRKYPDLRYAYVGGIVSEEYHQQVSEASRELGVADQVVYLGTACPGEELNRIYNTAEATICASEYEGFSLAIVESMSAGIPVLIHKNAPFSLGDGCALYDGDDFAEKLESLLADEDRKLGQEARENVVKHYSWERIARDYADAFAQSK